jgi:hypothetical protein
MEPIILLDFMVPGKYPVPQTDPPRSQYILDTAPLPKVTQMLEDVPLP